MFHTITRIVTYALGSLIYLYVAMALSYGQNLKAPINDIFSHSRHESFFVKNKVSCRDCHNFSVKPTAPGPLAPDVDVAVLRPRPQLCHQCHRGQNEAIELNQCTLCHKNNRELMPKDHLHNWKKRHGQFATFDQNTCKTCHATGECLDCHMQRETTVKRVHSGNFKLTHSIEARGNPQSCITCHQTPSFCLDCHKGSR